jgi:hypothetical protein
MQFHLQKLIQKGGVIYETEATSTVYCGVYN